MYRYEYESIKISGFMFDNSDCRHREVSGCAAFLRAAVEAHIQ